MKSGTVKVYSISKWAFWGIFFLILSLPVARNWKLLVSGTWAEGEVGAYVPYKKEITKSDYTLEYASEISFRAGDSLVTTRGPGGYDYDPGRKVKVAYDPGDPARTCVVTFSGFYLTNYSALILGLLVLWGAFYLSFNRYAGKKRTGRSRVPASSPYAPFRKAGSGKKERPRLLHGVLIAWILCSGWAGFLPVQLLAREIPVEPSMNTEAISALLNKVRPGDTLRFRAGTYTGPFVLSGVHGEPGAPVVIAGETASGSVIDGKAEPGMFMDQQAFRLSGCSWITIEHLTIRNCWTDLVRAEESSYISLRHCSLEGGKRALFATGRGSHHFLVEHCRWEQDPRVWTHEEDYSWEEIHHGIHRHYNGSIFQGFGISGVFVLRDNEVRNTFNAFRLSLINEGEFDPLACTNGEIYRNIVYNTSDNVFEPELHAYNLHYYHNRMVNGHAFISITEVAGGEIYIYGNTAVSLPESEDGWTIFKISGNNRVLTAPLYIYNNSWQVDFDIIGSPRNVWKDNHLRHFNNASVSETGEFFGIYDLGADNRFDYDCSNLPFPTLLTEEGFERHGLVADPLFTDPYGNDFRLQPGSPCIDRGVMKEGLIMGYAGKAPDIGAYDNGELVQGPPFRFVALTDTLPFQERPRITRHRIEGRSMRLWFSSPLEERSVMDRTFRITTGERVSPLELDSLSGGGYCLTLKAAGDLPDGPAELGISRWPLGTNGMPATGWASTLPVTVFGESAPGKEQVLQATRKVADKVLDETRFSYRMVPLDYNGGITRFDLPAGSGPEDENLYYAFSRMESETEVEGWLGFSFRGNLRIFLNGEEIFNGSSPEVKIREYTYNRYRFQMKVPVTFRQGVNELLVRCETGSGNSGSGADSGPVKFLVLPLDETDAKIPDVNALPVAEEVPGSHWLVSGPWQAASPLNWNSSGGSSPEEGFREYYTTGGKIIGWEAEEVPMLRELVIPPSASYTRDPYSDWHYANGGTLLGILSLQEATGDPRYLDFVKQYADNLVENESYFRWQYEHLHAMRGSFHRLYRMTMLDDSGGPALPLLQLMRMGQGQEAYREILDRVYDYVVHGQERLPDSTYCRPEPEASTVWADDLFMLVPFLLRMAEERQEPGLYDEVARQVTRFNRYLRDPETGLWFHGWYDLRQENTPVRWGRANGWIVWATSEALLHLPPSHPSYPAILEIFREHMGAIVRYQAPSGMWHQVPDHPETYEETSCTAMYTLGLARGVREGWLPEAYREYALKGWRALQDKIRTDGTVIDICRGTEIGNDVAFYQARRRFDHDPRGLGAVITAGVEIATLVDL